VTGCPYLDADGVNKALGEWISHKDDNILTYRDKSFSPSSPVPWLVLIQLLGSTSRTTLWKRALKQGAL
jgi:hypothetical protein